MDTLSRLSSSFFNSVTAVIGTIISLIPSHSLLVFFSITSGSLPVLSESSKAEKLFKLPSSPSSCLVTLEHSTPSFSSYIFIINTHLHTHPHPHPHQSILLGEPSKFTLYCSSVSASPFTTCKADRGAGYRIWSFSCSSPMILGDLSFRYSKLACCTAHSTCTALPPLPAAILGSYAYNFSGCGSRASLGRPLMSCSHYNSYCIAKRLLHTLFILI
ncbi:hypothetical protein HD806DRAFT_276307 [Xylariaceae sp. AK1471]|nr:hypothetical protein HD806DRAFT_276307 [Xylariaceae sp. AK1471]